MCDILFCRVDDLFEAEDVNPYYENHVIFSLVQEHIKVFSYKIILT